ncbi:cupin domain-containing protein [Phreatobacter stygius]|uniref:Cupin n=1 Tax=Phreatobacter stygius TaxID=1940610 RepID=A0A4D7B532_9HYPH|nr:cupin domain-containing protein [Phreatobacter stygius]QCI68514.1 cupin [Phreatobacter stygius]
MTPQTLFLERRHWVPNNPVLPVLLYREAFEDQPGEPMARAMEERFARNGWPPLWRNGVYAFHHYHLEAHEVLGVAAGAARLALGGPGGPETKVRAGDVLVLPAGTGHVRIAASDDFLVIGAYPPGQAADIVRDAPTPDMIERMLTVDFPASDPVLGPSGALVDLWTKPEGSPAGTARPGQGASRV